MIDIAIGALIIYGIFICRKATIVDEKLTKGIQWALIFFLFSLIYQNLSILYMSHIIEYLISSDVDNISTWVAYLSLPTGIFQFAAFIILILTLHKGKNRQTG
jgi:hypothetical protein